MWYRCLPRLRAEVHAPFGIFEFNPQGEPEFEGLEMHTAVRIANIGTETTTITSVNLSYWPSSCDKVLRRAATHFEINPLIPEVSPDLPFELKGGDEWVGGVDYHEWWERMAKGLLYFDVHHTMSRSPLRVRVKEQRWE